MLVLLRILGASREGPALAGREWGLKGWGAHDPHGAPGMADGTTEISEGGPPLFCFGTLGL